ncbi:unnamed protein product [Pieris brassicae]|uniref:Uncharacterized protein n=1 Tax=Pieris brassicae TaxID=7116 RepID=A0A9P0TXK5_PIEBR|nr:unnamed protein product [Pieris brassicae]
MSHKTIATITVSAVDPLRAIWVKETSSFHFNNLTAEASSTCRISRCQTCAPQHAWGETGGNAPAPPREPVISLRRDEVRGREKSTCDVGDKAKLLAENQLNAGILHC